MARREDRKPKEAKQPKEASLTLDQKKQKMREDIRRKFNLAFSYEDEAIIPNRRSK